jgi:hypothetical protein
MVGPRSALRSELAPTHDLGTDAGAPAAGEGIVDPGSPTRIALRFIQAAEGARREEPVVEPATGVPKGRLKALALAGAEAVERYGEVVDPNA